MRIESSVFIATSLDGFIARPDGAVDWLHGAGDEDGEEDYGYQDFIDSVDAIVMGRKTFETVLALDAWPYGEKPVIVLSSRDLGIPEHIRETVEAMSGAPREVVQRLAERGFRHLYVDGGETIQRFLAEGLIRRLIITRIPILIGSGIPLFGPLPQDVHLRHISTRSFPGSLVQSRYEVPSSAG